MEGAWRRRDLEVWSASKHGCRELWRSCGYGSAEVCRSGRYAGMEAEL
jgi:hypothetical protein